MAVASLILCSRRGLQNPTMPDELARAGHRHGCLNFILLIPNQTGVLGGLPRRGPCQDDALLGFKASSEGTGLGCHLNAPRPKTISIHDFHCFLLKILSPDLLKLAESTKGD